MARIRAAIGGVYRRVTVTRSYQPGPLDLVSGAAAGYSVARKLRAAYSGALIRIRRSSDNAEQDIGALPNGLLDTAAAAAFIGGGSGFITTIYDQSGNTGRNIVQATAANQPQYQSDSSALFDGSNDTLQSAAFTLNQPESVLLVAKQVTWTLNDGIFGGLGSGQGAMVQNDTTPRVLIGASANTLRNGDWTLDTYAIVTSVFNGASSSIRINENTAATGDVGAGNMGGFRLGNNAGGTAPGNIRAKEVIIYPTDSAVDRGVVRANQNAFYGIY